MDEKIPVKHVVIDEAQDFSAFQIYVNIVLDKVKGREVNKGRPVIRHGEEVRITAMPDTKAIVQEIARNINDFRNQSFKSVAVICKTLKECRDVHARLSKQVGDIELVNGKEEVYKGGVVVAPSCLAKGLAGELTPLLRP